MGLRLVPPAEAAPAPVQIGLKVETVLAHWGFASNVRPDLKEAVEILLGTDWFESATLTVGRLEAVGRAIRRARQMSPIPALAAARGDRILPSRVAKVFGLTPLQQAVLVELWFLAGAMTSAEIAGHCDQALVRLDQAIAEAR